MNKYLNVALTALVAALAAAAPIVAPTAPNLAVWLGGAAAILKVVDGILTPTSKP